MLEAICILSLPVALSWASGQMVNRFRREANDHAEDVRKLKEELDGLLEIRRMTISDRKYLDKKRSVLTEDIEAARLELHTLRQAPEKVAA